MAGSASPSNSSKKIGLRVKNARMKKFDRAIDAAQKFGTTQQRWSLMETGKVVFDSELLLRLASFLEVSPAFLLTGYENAPSMKPEANPAREATPVLTQCLQLQEDLTALMRSLLTEESAVDLALSTDVPTRLRRVREGITRIKRSLQTEDHDKEVS